MLKDVYVRAPLSAPMAILRSSKAVIILSWPGVLIEVCLLIGACHASSPQLFMYSLRSSPVVRDGEVSIETL